MNRRLARTVVALAIPALAVPALTTPAVAAPKGPAVPAIEEVAEIYPHLAGGTVDVEPERVRRIQDDCSDGKPYAGAKLRGAYYNTADGSLGWTARTPYVSIAAVSFRKVAQASEFLEDYAALSAECLALEENDPDVKVTSKKIPFELGDQSVGRTVTITSEHWSYAAHVLLAREGKVLTITFVVSGKPSPVKKAVRLERLALDTAS